jgi:hypothetical protein
MTLGLKLWRHYNKKLLKQHRKQAFPILSFDWNEQQFHQELDRAAHSMGLQKTSDEVFFTQDLVNNSSGPDQLPWSIKRIYKQLIAKSS